MLASLNCFGWTPHVEPHKPSVFPYSQILCPIPCHLYRSDWNTVACHQWEAVRHQNLMPSIETQPFTTYLDNICIFRKYLEHIWHQHSPGRILRRILGDQIHFMALLSFILQFSPNLSACFSNYLRRLYHLLNRNNMYINWTAISTLMSTLFIYLQCIYFRKQLIH